ncbi:amidohydrolase [Flavobacterium oreochromis]|uniref:Amidohydrolase n=2 Tax=Flavobacterium TaxID=237 RepID=A0A246GB09_9FLAO|nr:amidohydrolase [Flavobacterium oreochromis]OWP76720.1 amidohydrolase [Flavobacterium oreochromis]OWP77438.1 amidohydrolase [Flavobacterium oreochromis]
MKSIFSIIILSSFTYFAASAQKQKADLVVTNATIYTVDKKFSKAEALAIRDGKIIGIGKSIDIIKKFQSTKVLNAVGKYIFPGLYDAHAHFYSFGLNLQKVDLRGTKSYQEVLDKIIQFQKEKKLQFITGRGWDQNDWDIKEFPTKKELDELFPTIPVVLTRIDGHALLANAKALELANITTQTKISGGEIQIKNNELTGILVDNPMELVYQIIPKPSKQVQVQALKDAENVMFQYGLTTINEAGLEKETINLIDSLQQKKELKINVYAMVNASQDNVDLYTQLGPYKTDHLNVRSFKFMGDGALGSRGACLHNPYSDRPNHYGALLSTITDIQKMAKQIADSEYQMNSHAIGDSTNTVLLNIYKEVLKNKPDRRWKIEHAQVLREQDFEAFSSSIIPSVQPTHATSDMYWAQERLGKERVKHSYAYKKMLDKAGVIALGTDFPIEEVNPMLTFYAAVARKDLKNYPEGGFQPENALSREETIKGMTIWSAYSNFEETEKGSLEIGKWADFVIYDNDLMTEDIDAIPYVKPVYTFIKGEQVKK